ncbi:gamma-glutamyltransferase family protein [Streptomyces sp. NPDC004752]
MSAGSPPEVARAFLRAGSRPLAVGPRGAVSCAHQYAASAGLDMLRAGGNAVDAAVAMAATLSVVEPQSTGAGGVGFMTIAVPGRPEPLVLDFMGVAPQAATPAAFSGPAARDIGVRAALVPGAVAGWAAALERFGRLGLADVLAPAIDHAQAGVPVSDVQHQMLSDMWRNLLPYPTTAKIFLPDGRVPRRGELIRQPDQARTLSLIAEGGAEVFYRGPVADEIVRFSQENGGLLTHDDLSRYEAVWKEPVSVAYRGRRVFCPPPPCEGFGYLLALAMLEHHDLSALEQDNPARVHLLSEVFKLAVADRIAYGSRPDTPWHRLLSPEYAAERAALVDPVRAATVEGERLNPAATAQSVQPGSLADSARECTTHLAAIDEEGYAVSCTYSLGGGPVRGFGSGVVFGTTGLPFNNMAHWFDLDPASPNVIAPGKRMGSPASPGMVFEGGRPLLALGTPGSWGILQTTPQMLAGVLDDGHDIQAAIEQPRFRVYGGRTLAVEDRFPVGTLRQLARWGHDVDIIGPWSRAVGGAHGVGRDQDTGTFSGGADPRRDGVALAW